jgi:hypothetical protein
LLLLGLFPKHHIVDVIVVCELQIINVPLYEEMNCSSVYEILQFRRHKEAINILLMFNNENYNHAVNNNYNNHNNENNYHNTMKNAESYFERILNSKIGLHCTVNNKPARQVGSSARGMGIEQVVCK